MKLLRITAVFSILFIFFGFSYKSLMMKPPELIKGTVKDLQVLKSETSLTVKFDYSEIMISKLKEKDWVAKQKLKGVEDEKKATEEFNSFWYKEVVPYQGEKFIESHNKAAENIFKLVKEGQTKYTLTLKPLTLFPSNNFGQIAVLTSDAIISETATGKIIAILEIPNINSGVPAMKERVAFAYAGAGKACALFFADALK